ncbi:kinesin-like protein Klp5 [Pseudogymnoascus destructans]|uniref:Kinesin-like protein Klp5 n=1 Tax=Pseudogymnoascus destructans TaxID=655981 RepID=A0A177A8C7_9PEZI|nr:kinesin-like protein Klp5 [Pseudogymnoascus destructans]OAF58397.1 kinesin-like protein Klp5 [Pseudogymnoascus destructans]
MEPPTGASSISVTVRVRPFTLKEAAQLKKCDDGTIFLGDGSLAAAPTSRITNKGIHPVIKVVDDKCLVFDPPEDNGMTKFSRGNLLSMGKRSKDQTFGFDRVFDENTTQGDVYEATTRSLLDSVLDGYNATVFAYGATGCGKTHTITGTAQQPGIIFLTMQELFEKIAERSDEKHTEVSLSYLEIYNETIRDLLEPGGSKQGLMLREDANQTVSVAALSSHHPKDVQEVMDMIVKGNEYRTISPTEANATSSRSHAVLQINVAQKDRNAAVNEPHTMATLSIIDLAGSERASVTKNRGDRLLEGANINKSLLALGSCINALCDPRKKNHVPYRNSKLTRLLKFSLGGNCRTVMIVCVSPSSAHFDETQNTLRYANRAKNIQTKVTRNVYNVNRHVKDFVIKIDEQMALITELRAQQKNYEEAAFVKFKKQTEKRDHIAKEGIARIRAAYELSVSERQEKSNNMKKLHQIERRISILSAWIASFDSICDNRDDGVMPPSLTSMRKTAQGILVELEHSRQHYHQRQQKNNWERAIDSAAQNSIRQLTEADGTTDGTEAASLEREAELLKANAARDALLEVVELEKSGDLGVMQVLLSAQFDLISSLGDILAMSQEDAVRHAKSVLTRLFNSCSTAASHVIKPDGSLNVTQAFPPTKRGTPKKKKQVNLFVDDETQIAPLTLEPLPAPVPDHVAPSPMRGSPRRRKVPGKKGISFTPNKKSLKKRSVRWRDDADSGALAEFEKTPQKLQFTPEASSGEASFILPPLPSNLASELLDDSTDSSPVPEAPQPSLDIKPKNSRFQAGFLSKRPDNTSPTHPTSTSPSFSDTSPLRSIDPTKAGNRLSTSAPPTSALANELTPSSTPDSSALTSDTENISHADSAKIRAALRQSRGSHAHSMSESALRTARRRSPTAASIVGGGSPPAEAHFSAGQARRMVGSGKEPVVGSVLSPRTAPVIKSASGGPGPRRTTIASSVGGMSAVQAVRLGAVGTPRQRESAVGVVGKGGWR